MTEKSEEGNGMEPLYQLAVRVVAAALVNWGTSLRLAFLLCVSTACAIAFLAFH